MIAICCDDDHKGTNRATCATSESVRSDRQGKRLNAKHPFFSKLNNPLDSWLSRYPGLLSHKLRT
jgi:hypothetical protein